MTVITVALEFTDTMVAAELQRLAVDASGHAQAATDKEERAYFRRGVAAYGRALEKWLDGVRPRPLPAGGYLLPSQRPGEAPHILTKDTDWRCTCEAGAAMHWAMGMVIAIEHVVDQVDADDVAPAQPVDRLPGGSIDDLFA